jgi:hypothetical protein
MSKEKDQSTFGTQFHRKSEGFLSQHPRQNPIPRHKDTQNLIHELQVYQGQLELQNNLMPSGLIKFDDPMAQAVNCGLPGLLTRILSLYLSADITRVRNDK